MKAHARNSGCRFLLAWVELLITYLPGHSVSSPSLVSACSVHAVSQCVAPQSHMMTCPGTTSWFDRSEVCPCQMSPVRTPATNSATVVDASEQESTAATISGRDVEGQGKGGSRASEPQAVSSTACFHFTKHPRQLPSACCSCISGHNSHQAPMFLTWTSSAQDSSERCSGLQETHLSSTPRRVEDLSAFRKVYNRQCGE